MPLKEKLYMFRASLLGIDPGVMTGYYKLFLRPRHPSIRHIIDQRAKKKRPFYFLQIGGNDGYIKDPVFAFVKKYPWKGIIVEPQKDVFERRLKATYRWEKKVILENVAIADKSGTRKLYKLAISNSRWATGLSTFDRKTLERHIRMNYVEERAKREGIELPDRMDDYITYEEVRCMTITDLLRKHQFQTLDLLQIDAEGYDFEIIKTIDFSKLKPALISFEREHIDDYENCRSLLEEKGYQLYEEGRNAIAFLD